MTRGVDEEEAAVDAGIDNVSIAHRGEFLSQVGRVLVLDVLDDGVPAVLVVHLVAVTGSVDNVQSQLDAVFDNHVRDGVDLGGLTNHLVRCKATLGVDEVRRKQRVDQRRLAQTRLTDDHHVELEAALEQLRLDLLGDRVEPDVRLQRRVVLCV